MMGAVVVALVSGICSATAGEPASTFPVVTGEVHGIAQSGTTTSVGGIVTKMGQSTGRAVLFGSQTGDFLPGFPKGNSPITCAISDCQGGFYISAVFAKVRHLPLMVIN